MWGVGVLMCNIVCGAPIYNQGDWVEKVKGEKKDRTVRHLGHQHQVTMVLEFRSYNGGEAEVMPQQK